MIAPYWLKFFGKNAENARLVIFQRLPIVWNHRVRKHERIVFAQNRFVGIMYFVGTLQQRNLVEVFPAVRHGFIGAAKLFAVENIEMANLFFQAFRNAIKLILVKIFDGFCAFLNAAKLQNQTTDQKDE